MDKKAKSRSSKKLGIAYAKAVQADAWLAKEDKKSWGATKQTRHE
jgi:hypothetical protein